MLYTLTIHYKLIGTRHYRDMSLERLVRFANLAATLGNEFDIKEQW